MASLTQDRGEVRALALSEVQALPPVVRMLLEIGLRSFCTETEGSHWLWRGTALGGVYPYLQLDRQRMSGTRLSYALHVGEIPPHAQVRRRCDLSLCVAPSHLYVTDGRYRTHH